MSMTQSASGTSILGEGPVWLIRLLVRGRIALVVLPLLAGILVFVITRQRMRYSADATIRPQATANGAARLSGLAAQFGVQLPGGSIGDPVRLYAELARSRGVLMRTAQASYAVARSPGSADSLRGTLLELLKVPSHGEDQLRRGMDRLQSLLDVSVNRDAGLVLIRARTPWPEMSRAILLQILRSMNEVTILREQARAEREREFIEGRLQEAKAELDSAEAAASGFLSRNRTYQGSPQLTLELGRLQRRVDLRQQVYVTLSQSYEQARLDEVRNTPSFSIVDGPEGPVREARRPVRDALVWMILTGGGVLLVMLVLDWLARFRAATPSAYEELIAATRSLLLWRRNG